MRRRFWLVVFIALVLLVACGPAGGGVTLYDLVSAPARYDQQEVTVLGYYYQKGDERILVAGVRTDDGFQNPVPLGDPLWVEGMPQSVLDDLNVASGVIYGVVQLTGRFETGGQFGPQGEYPSRLVIIDPEAVVALEAAQMREDRVPADLRIPGAVTLEELVTHPEQYDGQTVVVGAYYYWTRQTAVLAEGIRSLDGVHNAVPIGEQVWVEGFPPEVSGELHVLPDKEHLENVHGLVKVTGRFETRGGYGAGAAYPYRLVVTEAEAIKR